MGIRGRSRRWFIGSTFFAGTLGGTLGAFSSRLGAAESTGKGRTLPAFIFRYADPSTEFPVLRLTDPEHTAAMPALYNRAVSRHNFLIYASDASGRFEAYRMDLHNGQSRQLTEAAQLDPASLTLTPDDKKFVYIDGGIVMEANLSSLKSREIYQIPKGFNAAGLSIAQDGLYLVIAERGKPANRLEIVNAAKGEAVKLAEAGDEIRDPSPRPKRASILYRRAGAMWLVNYDGQHNYRLRAAEGETGPAQWSPDGRAVLYLNIPSDKTKLHNLREFTPDTNEDKMIANTTQFATFSANADASVFVGASGSKASPHVLLLVREVGRELTLAEHRASDPKMVAPVFSPNSQRVFFMSDQHGKPAIYTMAVDKLVEETGDEKRSA